jgi:hypothetical protein
MSTDQGWKANETKHTEIHFYFSGLGRAFTRGGTAWDPDNSRSEPIPRFSVELLLDCLALYNEK